MKKRIISRYCAMAMALCVLLSVLGGGFAFASEEMADSPISEPVETSAAPAQEESMYAEASEMAYALDAAADEDTAADADESEDNALLNFVGDYAADRCTLTVEANEAPNASIHVIWGQSATETVEYYMSGAFDSENMCINYTGGVKEEVVYDEDGFPNSTVVYDDGVGSILFYLDGSIQWTIENEDVELTLKYLDNTQELITVTADFGADHADYAKMFAGVSDELYLEDTGYQVACKVPKGVSLKEAMSSFFNAFPETYADGGKMLDTAHYGFALKSIDKYANEDELSAESATYGDVVASEDFTIYALWLEPTDAAITVEAPTGGTTVTKKGEGESDPKPVAALSGHIHVMDGLAPAWMEKDAAGEWRVFEGVMEQGKKYNALVAAEADFGYYISDKGVTVNGKAVENPEIYFGTMLLTVTELEAKAVEPTTTPKEYVFLSGEHAFWTTGDSDLSFRVDGDYADFTGVKVDGTLIDAKNYTSASGSTVVNLKAAYLATLSEGKHTLTVVYKDGEVSTDFTLKKAASASTDNKATPSPSPNNTKSAETSPKTGDESNILPWALLLGASVFGLGAAVSRKRKEKDRVGNQ